jgi:hypothetical protein
MFVLRWSSDQATLPTFEAARKEPRHYAPRASSCILLFVDTHTSNKIMIDACGVVAI